MARGLSTLQKEVLKKAYERHLDPQPFYACSRWSTEAERAWSPEMLELEHGVWPEEILASYYGWPTDRSLRGTPQTHGGATFTKREVGEREYTKGWVAVRRAFDRLQNRGLIEWHVLTNGWNRVQGKPALLTKEGLEVAKSLAE